MINNFIGNALFGSSSGNSPVNHSVKNFVDNSLEAFNDIDKDNDGYLTKSELNSALHSSSFKQGKAAAVVTMYKLIDDIEEFSNDEWGDENSGITRKDLNKVLHSSEDNQQAKKMSSRYFSTEGDINKTNFSFLPDGLSSIRPDHIEQGAIGDCHFLAAIGSIAEKNPERLKDMITDNTDGSFTVTFPGKDPVKVDQPTHGEVGLYSTAGQDGLWLSILEKAYAKHNYDNAWIGYENEYDHVGGSFLGKHGMATITGNGTNADNLSVTSLSTLRSRLTHAMNNDLAVTTNLRKSLNPFGDGRRQGLPMGHVYSILNYNSSTDEVTIRNPWGYAELTNSDGHAKDGVNDGEFTMSLEDYADTFSFILYENP